MAKKLTLNDENVDLTLAQIAEKKKALQSKISRFIPTTNMNLELFGQRYNLHAQTAESLRFLLAFLQSLSSEINGQPVVLSGYLLEDWRTDMRSKIQDIDIKRELEKLNIAETKLQQMYSEQKKTQNEFDDILDSIL